MSASITLKEVVIMGTLPEDCHEHYGLLRYLGKFNSPAAGIRIAWLRGRRKKPNQPRIYPFVITGRERVSWQDLQQLLGCIEGAGGEITDQKGRNITEDGPWIGIMGVA